MMQNRGRIALQPLWIVLVSRVPVWKSWLGKLYSLAICGGAYRVGCLGCAVPGCGRLLRTTRIVFSDSTCIVMGLAKSNLLSHCLLFSYLDLLAFRFRLRPQERC